MPQIFETGKFAAKIFRLTSISYIVLPSARVELKNRLSGGTGPLLKEETVKMFRILNILVHPTLKVEFKFKAKKIRARLNLVAKPEPDPHLSGKLNPNPH
jgi:hypothetical protein